MKIVLVQLPIPQTVFGRRTGNIALGAACLKTSAASLTGADIFIIPEIPSSYLGDAALMDYIVSEAPDILGFTVFNWNLERTLYFAERIKQRIPVKIAAGGPEITPDNIQADSPFIDFRIFGEGEAVFSRLIEEPEFWNLKTGAQSAADIFRAAQSPYLSGYPETEIEDIVLIETQRGCPYRCGFCYYNKAHGKVVRSPVETAAEVIAWAKDRGVGEAFLLDPSLDARPDLITLLDEIIRINKDRRLSLVSEIRAEPIDSDSAKKFAAAGFTEFEIGLQTLTPEALKLMNRTFERDRFLSGVECLKREGIRPKIDLIIGLPGDSPDGFKRSVDFMAQHDICDDVQVFFLSVLPGTAFRKNSRALGLNYQFRPPYTVLETANFSPDDLLGAYYYAEDRFDLALHPPPDIDLAYRGGGSQAAWKTSRYINKAVILKKVSVDRIRPAARRLTNPYQVFFGQEAFDLSFIRDVLNCLTSENPHTPLEIVFLEPPALPDIDAVENALMLSRPLYLDSDIPAVGSRSVMFTVVSGKRRPLFGGIMKRQVFWWRDRRFPGEQDLETLDFADGILLDNDAPPDKWKAWMEETADAADRYLHISFADPELQDQWIEMVKPEEYAPNRSCIAGMIVFD